jgi:hypothetical protein
MGESGLRDETRRLAQNASRLRAQDFEPHVFIVSGSPGVTGIKAAKSMADMQNEATTMHAIDAALQGMQQAEWRLERAAERIGRMPLVAGDLESGDVVSLSEEVAALLLAKETFSASARVFHTGAGMEQRVIDLLA